MDKMDRQLILGSIGFENLRIRTIIGVGDEERLKEREIFIDIKVEGNFHRCVGTDHLNDTIDYVQLADFCSELIQRKKYRLIETLAYEVVEALLMKPSISKVSIRVKKPQALPNADFAIVELTKQKSGISR